MAEIPPHLLERAKARRAALSGGGDAGATEASAAPAPTPATQAAAAPATAAPAAATPPAKAAPAPVVVKDPPPPRGSIAARFAAVFFLAVTPIWAFFMYGAFGVPRASADSPKAIGERLYNVNCVGCHGGNGAGSDGGGAGRPLYNGSVEKTFPDPLQQAAFVKHGSCDAGTPYGDPKREGGQHIGQQKGIMPNFKDLTDEDILFIVQYERSAFSGKDYPANLLAKAGEDASVPPKEEINFEELKLAEIPVCGS